MPKISVGKKLYLVSSMDVCAAMEVYGGIPMLNGGMLYMNEADIYVIL